MTRIFNTAKKQLAGSEDKSWENEENKYNTINDIAKNLYKKAGGEKLKIDNIKAERTAQTEQVGQIEQQETSPQIQTVSSSDIYTQEKFQQAKNLVIQNISNLDLPSDMDKSKLQAALSRVQQKPINFPDRELSTGDIANALIFELLKEAYPEKTDSHELKRIAISNTVKLLPNDTIAKVKVSELNTQFIGDLASIDEVSPSADFKANVEKAVQLLNTQLKNFSEDDLKTLGISAAKRDRLLNYINSIIYDSTHNSGQGKGLWIVMSTNWKESDNISSMIALLMHEANHCNENYLSQHPEESEQDNYRFRNSSGDPHNNRICNTKEEERACETLGMLTAGILARKGAIPDYSRYNGHSVKDYIDDNGNPTQLLKDDINQ